jgi:tetratricopeptide (TPR) repeat protein
VERLAVVPPENLTGTTGLDWVAPALAHLVAWAPAGSPSLHAFVVTDTNEAFRRRASAILRGYVTGNGRHLKISAVLQDTTGAAMRTLTASGSEVTGLAETLARQLSPQVRSLKTRNREAVELYGRALLDASSPDAQGLLHRAIQIDPTFADARLLLSQLRRTAPEPTGAGDPIDAARIELFSAQGERRLAAVERLAALLPADAEAATYASDLQLEARQFAKAAEWRRRALRADPEFAQNWNLLAYAQSRAGDLNAAIQSIREYGRRVSGGNADDSLGEIYFMHGRFADAESAFLTAYQKQPGLLASATLRKAAEARRMTGDQREADLLFQRFLDAHSRHPLRELFQAQWDYTSGREQAALDRVEKLANATNASTAWAQLAVWRRVRGVPARQAAEKALRTAVSPQERLHAAVASFLVLPPAPPEEWASRAKSFFGARADPRVPQAALAHALLAGSYFAAALPIVESLHRQGSPLAANEWVVPLAWCLTETGKAVHAKPLLLLWPVPDSSAGNPFQVWSYPRVKLLR